MEETKAIKAHREWKGKIEITSKMEIESLEDLAICYTPGVAEACLKIKEEKEESFNLTGRKNMVAIVTDGTAILGLGDIGPEAGMPVMEGKAVLFKKFGDINAVPLCISTTDTEEIIKFCKYIEPSFSGINLEDISAPRCFEIESRLKKELSIPVFHDDQHGTAIVVGAALINALKVTGKKLDEIKVVVNGAGAAGCAISRYLIKMGVTDLTMVDRIGIINKCDKYDNPMWEEMKEYTNKACLKGTLKDAMVGKDLFIGVSAPNIVSKEMVESMAEDPIVFTLANPVPEISYELAREAGAKVVGTGSSKKPNQINNCFVFPGIFRGAIDAGNVQITDKMMIKASEAIASSVKDSELTEEHILPYVLDKSVHERLAKAVMEEGLNN